MKDIDEKFLKRIEEDIELIKKAKAKTNDNTEEYKEETNEIKRRDI